MTDIVTYCDVNNCTECPRYGDDCDGDKRVEHTDYISRADAMGAVQDHFNANGFKGYDDGQKMMDRIKALPSADAVHGEWIWRTDIPIGDGRTSAGYICSNCGKDYWHGNVFDFCPNCGARMKGGDSE